MCSGEGGEGGECVSVSVVGIEEWELCCVPPCLGREGREGREVREVREGREGREVSVCVCV